MTEVPVSSLPDPARIVWFITGAGQGLGRAIALAALERGDFVAATTRNIADVADLAERFGERVLPLAFDVRDRSAAAPAIAATRERFGRVDVVVNNAARPANGAVEEVTEAAARDVIETNLLGTLWVTQAALPVMRAQGSGHIVQISSGGGVISWPTNGVYQATKFGLEGMSEALAQESRHLGIKVTIAHVGHMATNFARYNDPQRPVIEAYAPQHAKLSVVSGRKGNDPAIIAAKLLKVVDSAEPPLRVLLGRPLDDIREAYQARLDGWEKWASII